MRIYARIILAFIQVMFGVIGVFALAWAFFGVADLTMALGWGYSWGMLLAAPVFLAVSYFLFRFFGQLRHGL